jgi:uncharacterized protein (DUF58 family)
VAGSILALGAWAAVAHNSGAGWVQALGALLAGFLLVGLVAPGFVVRRTRCTVAAGPADAVAGRASQLTVTVSGPVAVRPLSPPGPESTTGRHPTCSIRCTPSARGVVTECVLQLASAAPFGLLWWTKRVTIPLPQPLNVAPQPAAPDQAGHLDPGAFGDDVLRVDRRVGESRGVRPYRAGDLRHWIHWPATAHAGTLMVREMEGPAGRPVTVRAVLPADPDAADDAAQRALATVLDLLAAGRTVVLVTAERDGEVAAPVNGAADAGRRLARSLPQRPPPRRPRPPRGRPRQPERAEPSGASPGVPSAISSGVPSPAPLADQPATSRWQGR